MLFNFLTKESLIPYKSSFIITLRYLPHEHTCFPAQSVDFMCYTNYVVNAHFKKLNTCLRLLF